VSLVRDLCGNSAGGGTYRESLCGAGYAAQGISPF